MEFLVFDWPLSDFFLTEDASEHRAKHKVEWVELQGHSDLRNVDLEGDLHSFRVFRPLLSLLHGLLIGKLGLQPAHFQQECLEFQKVVPIVILQLRMGNINLWVQFIDQGTVRVG